MPRLPTARCKKHDGHDMTTQHETSGPRPVAFRGGDFTPRTYKIFGAAALIGLIAFWQLASSAGWVSPFFAPSPMRVVNALGQMAASGVLAEHIGASLARLFAGFALGMTSGIGIGLMIGLFSIFRSPGVAVVSALFP